MASQPTGVLPPPSLVLSLLSEVKTSKHNPSDLNAVTCCTLLFKEYWYISRLFRRNNIFLILRWVTRPLGQISFLIQWVKASKLRPV